MNITEFKTVVTSDRDWIVTLRILKNHYGRNVSVDAGHRYGAFIYLTDFSFQADPLTVKRALDSAGIKYTIKSDFPELLTEFKQPSGDPLPVTPEAQPIQTVKRCAICKKRGFKRPTNCLNFAEQGNHWQCQLNADFVGSKPVSPLVWRNGGLA